MSFLLRNVWRNVLRKSSFNSKLLIARTITSTLKDQNSPDSVMSKLKLATHPNDVLRTVSAHLPTMEHQDTLLALRKLFQLERSKKSEDLRNLTSHPAFVNLCQNVMRHARVLEIDEILDVTKVLTYLKVPAHSKIVQTMLQLIRYQINNLNTNQIFFLDFLLDKCDSKSHLIDALRLALPLAFQIRLPLELDSNDLLALKNMLKYCSKYRLPDKCIDSVVSGLLLHEREIDGQSAKFIIWSLLEINCSDNFPARAQLFHICSNILAQSINSSDSELTEGDVVWIVGQIKENVKKRQYEYYNEKLMDAMANYVVKKRFVFNKALLIGLILSRMGHSHLELMEYLCDEAISDPTNLADAPSNILYSFINCLSNNDYMPEIKQWNEIYNQMSLNSTFNGDKENIIWMRVGLELASLGHYEDKLIKKIFSRNFLDEIIAKDRIWDYIYLLELFEAVKTFHNPEITLPEKVFNRAKSLYPTRLTTNQIIPYLASGLGGEEFVAKNVSLPNGIISDAFMCLKSGKPVSLNSPGGRERVLLEELDIPEGSIQVCIMNLNKSCYSINTNRLRGKFRLILDMLEIQGYAVVPVNLTELLKAPEYERTPYLMREVQYKCGNLRNNIPAN